MERPLPGKFPAEGGHGQARLLESVFMALHCAGRIFSDVTVHEAADLC
jgi:hypothetical protein